jgi:hypothetical protein
MSRPLALRHLGLVILALLLALGPSGCLGCSADGHVGEPSGQETAGKSSGGGASTTPEATDATPDHAELKAVFLAAVHADAPVDITRAPLRGDAPADHHAGRAERSPLRAAEPPLLGRAGEAVGAAASAVADADRGVAYEFVRRESDWSQKQEIADKTRMAGEHVDPAIAIAGDTAIVGSARRGVAYVFTRSGSGWSKQQRLTAGDEAAGDSFGWSVSLSEDTALVGAPDTTIGADARRGAAYVFTRSGAAWSQQRRLTADDGAAGDSFGESVSLSGDVATIGAPGKRGAKSRPPSNASGNGTACTVDSDCTSAHCLDGVCCSTATCAACQSCNVSGSAGTCANIPSGQPDNNPSNTCDGGGTLKCNGAGACKLVNGQVCSAGTQCLSVNCVDGVCCVSLSCATCKSCNLPSNPGTCTNIAANQPDTTPANACDGGGAFRCDGAGTCKRVNGQGCSVDTECLSNNCVDGLCCNAVCPTCQACNLPGSLGTCANIAANQPDNNPPNACNSSSTQFCDGAGNCKAINGVSCSSSSQCQSNNCVDGICCSTPSCVTCQACNMPSSLGTCANIVVGQPDNNPPSACSGVSACDGAGNCKSVNGQACMSGNDCANGFCLDGVCCGSSSCGGCQSCNVSGSAGTCANIPAGQPDTFPANTCDASGTMKCDGLGTCKSVLGVACSIDVQCLSGHCIDSVCCNAVCPTCQSCSLAGSAGTCTNIPPGLPDTFPANACDSGGTLVCNGSAACKAVAGQVCSTGTQCLSGNCVDGVCCGKPTCAACQSCGLAGSEGVCANIPAGQPDTLPANTCDASGTKVCDGLGNCKVALGRACMAGTDCLSTFCLDGVCCSTAACNPCQACNVTTSPGTCANIPVGLPDNNPPNTCDMGGTQSCDGSGNCRNVGGLACMTGKECVSGFCVDGVCCDSASCSSCQSCNVTGNVGSCANLPANQPDDNPADTCNMGGTRACDGAGSCKLVNGPGCTSGAECVSGNCVDGVCCGKAACATCQSCGLAGSAGTCTNIAAGQPDTFPVNACDAGGTQLCDGTGACKAIDGQSCSTANQCMSGNCVDDVCCGKPTCAACQSCGLAGSEGLCANIPAGQPDTSPTDTCDAGGARVCDGAGHCKGATGQTCAMALDCQSGNCVDGVCCGAPSCATCQSCNVAGSAGTCTNVPAGQPDNEPVDACNAFGTQLCDGAGNCKSAIGQSCVAEDACASGICVDGYCCDTPCGGGATDDCQACNVEGAEGTCSPITAGRIDCIMDTTEPAGGGCACDLAGEPAPRAPWLLLLALVAIRRPLRDGRRRATIPG